MLFILKECDSNTSDNRKHNTVSQVSNLTDKIKFKQSHHNIHGHIYHTYVCSGQICCMRAVNVLEDKRALETLASFGAHEVSCWLLKLSRDTQQSSYTIIESQRLRISYVICPSSPSRLLLSLSVTVLLSFYLCLPNTTCTFQITHLLICDETQEFMFLLSIAVFYRTGIREIKS